MKRRDVSRTTFGPRADDRADEVEREPRFARARPRVQRKASIRLSDAIGSLAPQLADSNEGLSFAWAIAVGEGLTRRTRLDGVEAGKLMVSVEGEPWRQALLSVRRQVLKRLQDILGEDSPRALLVSVDDDDSHSWPPPVDCSVPAAAVDPSPMHARSADFIRDPDLRRAFERARAAQLRADAGRL